MRTKRKRESQYAKKSRAHIEVTASIRYMAMLGQRNWPRGSEAYTKMVRKLFSKAHHMGNLRRRGVKPDAQDRKYRNI